MESERTVGKRLGHSAENKACETRIIDRFFNFMKQLEEDSNRGVPHAFPSLIGLSVLMTMALLAAFFGLIALMSLRPLAFALGALMMLVLTLLRSLYLYHRNRSA